MTPVRVNDIHNVVFCTQHGHLELGQKVNREVCCMIPSVCVCACVCVHEMTPNKILVRTLLGTMQFRKLRPGLDVAS